MKPLFQISFLSLLLVIAGCAVFVPKETLYLRSAQDQATQEEVRQRLGQPTLVSSTQSDTSVWVYQFRTYDPGARASATGTWCDEYVLTFDGQAVLRRWTHRSHFDGLSTATYCVPAGYQEKS